MDVRDLWLVRLSKLQAEQKVNDKNFEFRKRLREQKAAQQAQAMKLKMMALAVAAAWIFAGIQCFR